ncbi:hypothetical protein F5884DRAFT_819299 [Xylogone sp. PMI_703]|nr:hypothetical protein F5884DRAFT_819299 [Xylogone sp. PMI_703]
MSTLSRIFSDSDNPAIIVPAKPNATTLSHASLKRHVQKLQEKLVAIRVTPGVPVAISMPSSLEFVVAFLAVACSRAISAPLNPAYKQDEVEFYVNDLNATILLVSQGDVEKESEAVKAARSCNALIVEIGWDGKEILVSPERKQNFSTGQNDGVEEAFPDDIALILHTSGTTGRPKAVKNIQATYDLTSNDRTLLVMPLFHIHGLVASLFTSLATGGSVIVPPRFSASKFWEDYIDHKATWYSAVPTVHQIILKNSIPSPPPFIRFIRSCSSPLPPTVFHELERKLRAPVLEAYAMTEASHQITSNPLPPSSRRPGSVGMPQGVEVRIKNDSGESLPFGTIGEVCIRGDNVTKGYLNNPAANQSTFTQDGFLRTGDQGALSSDGYLTLTGRIKELINKGGEKISPIELDNTYSQHPHIAEAVSFAVHDELYGQDIGVAVVVKEGHKLSAEEFVNWIIERAVKFKVPKQVFFTKVMPKTATGKVQRRLVAETMLAQEKLQEQAHRFEDLAKSEGFNENPANLSPAVIS